MRKLRRNSVITIRAMKRHPSLILGESGRNYLIKADAYTNEIPFGKWFYWILKDLGNDYKVYKVLR